MPVFPSPDYLSDLHSFDLGNMTWKLLSALPDGGPPPAARGYHGFTSVGGKLYVYGGQNQTGDAMMGKGCDGRWYRGGSKGWNVKGVVGWVERHTRLG
jgi:hypothetical protein